MKAHIRWIIRRDIPEILEIESRSFEYAWTEEDFLILMRQRNNISLVAEIDEKIVGYLFYGLEKRKIEIINLCVHPDHRRCGIGTHMIDKLKSKLSPPSFTASERRIRLYTLVRETNLVAHKFFSRNGFRAKSVKRKYFEDSGEDAYLFSYRCSIDENPT